MKTCPHCGAVMEDEAVFCTNCGGHWSGGEGGGPRVNTPYNPDPNPDGYPYRGGYAFPYDHTAEFTQQDIHENKVICLIIYLLGIIGIIIAMLGTKESPFVSFHVRQALKITVLEILTGIATLILFWTVIMLIVGPVFLFVLFVIRIICFVRICSGKAIEPPIVRSIGFLN